MWGHSVQGQCTPGKRRTRDNVLNAAVWFFWVQTLALPLASCVSLGKLLNCSEPQFPHQETGDQYNRPYKAVARIRQINYVTENIAADSREASVAILTQPRVPTMPGPS